MAKATTGAPDPRDETPPKADKDTPSKPAADANPDEALNAPGINYMNTVGLTAAQKARVEGTVLDGANGAQVLGIDPTTGAAKGSEHLAKISRGG